MYERTIPVTCGYTPQEILTLCKRALASSDAQRPLFFDIETTGFSRSRCSVYLIGCVSCEAENGWMLHQWLASPEEEPLLLEAFSAFSKDFDLLISYNGDAFDLPFLQERAALYGLSLPGIPSLDLYKALKPLSSFLKLASMKQPMVEAFLGFTDRIWPDGGDCIRAYKKYLKAPGEEASDPLVRMLLGHNEEDLQGLQRIPSLMAFHSVPEGKLSAVSAQREGNDLLLTFTLEEAMPVPHSFGKDAFYLTLKEHTGRVLLKDVSDHLKLYYENVKDYYYIPSEDTALPRSLCSGIGRERRKAATRDTCYTYFPLNQAFFENTDRQTRYIRSLLRYYLS